MSQNVGNLMPVPVLKHMPYTDASPSTQYEGVKAQARAELSVVESCLGKCSVNFSSAGAAGLSAGDSACMSRCFNKFFNASLVSHKELALYTVGMDAVN